jgi:hypothetical protein
MSNGEADYLLMVDKKAVGVIEAKPIGVTLSGVADQTDKYLKSTYGIRGKEDKSVCTYGIIRQTEETYVCWL